MSKTLDCVRKRMVWSNDRGWHLPKPEPYNAQKDTKIGGRNTFYKGTRAETSTFPRYD